jgi:hypothetical protein
MSFLKMLEDTSSSKVEDTSETESIPVGPTLKDRMRAYTSGAVAATTKATLTLRTNPHRSSTADNKQYAASFAVREHPPKINIYEKPKLFEDEKKEDGSLETEGRTLEIERRTLETERRTLETDLGRSTNTRTKSSSITNNGSLTPSGHDYGSRRPSFKSGGKVANSFLTAIHPQPLSPRPPPSYANKQVFPKTTAPVSEIGDEHGGGCDMSSVSGEDFPRVPDIHNVTHKKPWQHERNRVNPFPELPAKPTKILGSTVSTLDATMAKLVDERVQAHVADLETKVGAQMRLFMQQVDDKVLLRIESMEGKIQDLQSTIEKLQSSGQQQSQGQQQPNNPMQEPVPRWR